MEVEFDTRFKHPWSMIVSGQSSSGKTVFNKQVLNKSDKQFEKYIGSILNGKTDTNIALESALWRAYIAGRVPRIKWARSHGV